MTDYEGRTLSPEDHKVINIALQLLKQSVNYAISSLNGAGLSLDSVTYEITEIEGPYHKDTAVTKVELELTDQQTGEKIEV